MDLSQINPESLIASQNTFESPSNLNSSFNYEHDFFSMLEDSSSVKPDVPTNGATQNSSVEYQCVVDDLFKSLVNNDDHGQKTQDPASEQSSFSKDKSTQYKKLLKMTKKVKEQNIQLESQIADYETKLAQKMYDHMTATTELETVRKECEISKINNSELEFQVQQLKSQVFQYSHMKLTKDKDDAETTELRKELAQKMKSIKILKKNLATCRSELSEKNKSLVKTEIHIKLLWNLLVEFADKLGKEGLLTVNEKSNIKDKYDKEYLAFEFLHDNGEMDFFKTLNDLETTPSEVLNARKRTAKKSKSDHNQKTAIPLKELNVTTFNYSPPAVLSSSNEVSSSDCSALETYNSAQVVQVEEDNYFPSSTDTLNSRQDNSYPYVEKLQSCPPENLSKTDSSQEKTLDIDSTKETQNFQKHIKYPLGSHNSTSCGMRICNDVDQIKHSIEQMIPAIVEKSPVPDITNLFGKMVSNEKGLDETSLIELKQVDKQQAPYTENNNLEDNSPQNVVNSVHVSTEPLLDFSLSDSVDIPSVSNKLKEQVFVKSMLSVETQIPVPFDKADKPMQSMKECQDIEDPFVSDDIKISLCELKELVQQLCVSKELHNPISPISSPLRTERSWRKKAKKSLKMTSQETVNVTPVESTSLFRKCMDYEMLDIDSDGSELSDFGKSHASEQKPDALCAFDSACSASVSSSNENSLHSKKSPLETEKNSHSFSDLNNQRLLCNNTLLKASMEILECPDISSSVSTVTPSINISKLQNLQQGPSNNLNTSKTLSDAAASESKSGDDIEPGVLSTKPNSKTCPVSAKRCEDGSINFNSNLSKSFKLMVNPSNYDVSCVFSPIEDSAHYEQPGVFNEPSTSTPIHSYKSSCNVGIDTQNVYLNQTTPCKRQKLSEQDQSSQICTKGSLILDSNKASIGFDLYSREPTSEISTSYCSMPRNNAIPFTDGHNHINDTNLVLNRVYTGDKNLEKLKVNKSFTLKLQTDDCIIPNSFENIGIIDSDLVLDESIEDVPFSSSQLQNNVTSTPSLFKNVLLGAKLSSSNEPDKVIQFKNASPNTIASLTDKSTNKSNSVLNENTSVKSVGDLSNLCELDCFEKDVSDVMDSLKNVPSNIDSYDQYVCESPIELPTKKIRHSLVISKNTNVEVVSIKTKVDCMEKDESGVLDSFKKVPSNSRNCELKTDTEAPIKLLTNKVLHPSLSFSKKNTVSGGNLKSYQTKVSNSEDMASLQNIPRKVKCIKSASPNKRTTILLSEPPLKILHRKQPYTAEQNAELHQKTNNTSPTYAIPCQQKYLGESTLPFKSPSTMNIQSKQKKKTVAVVETAFTAPVRMRGRTLQSRGFLRKENVETKSNGVVKEDLGQNCGNNDPNFTDQVENDESVILKGEDPMSDWNYVTVEKLKVRKEHKRNTAILQECTPVSHLDSSSIIPDNSVKVEHAASKRKVNSANKKLSKVIKNKCSKKLSKATLSALKSNLIHANSKIDNKNTVGQRNNVHKIEVLKTTIESCVLPKTLKSQPENDNPDVLEAILKHPSAVIGNVDKSKKDVSYDLFKRYKIKPKYVNLLQNDQDAVESTSPASIVHNIKVSNCDEEISRHDIKSNANSQPALVIAEDTAVSESSFVKEKSAFSEEVQIATEEKYSRSNLESDSDDEHALTIVEDFDHKQYETIGKTENKESSKVLKTDNYLSSIDLNFSQPFVDSGKQTQNNFICINSMWNPSYEPQTFSAVENLGFKVASNSADKREFTVKSFPDERSVSPKIISEVGLQPLYENHSKAAEPIQRNYKNSTFVCSNKASSHSDKSQIKDALKEAQYKNDAVPNNIKKFWEKKEVQVKTNIALLEVKNSERKPRTLPKNDRQKKFWQMVQKQKELCKSKPETKPIVQNCLPANPFEHIFQAIQKMQYNDDNFKYNVHSLVGALINPAKVPNNSILLFHVLNYLCNSRKKPLLTFMENKDMSTLFPPDENCIVTSLFQIELKTKQHLEGLLKTAVTTIQRLVLSKKKLNMCGVASLCRVFTEISKRKGDRVAPLTLCSELLKMRNQYAPFLIASIAGVWKDLFQLGDDLSDDEIIYHSAIAYGAKQKRGKLATTLWNISVNIIDTFSTAPAVPDARKAINLLMHIIEMRCDNDALDNIYMLTSAFVIFAVNENWEWVKVHLVNQTIVPHMKKFGGETLNEEAFNLFCDMYVDLLLASPGGNIDTQLRKFFDKKASNEDETFVKDSAALALLKMALLKNRNIPSFLSTWFENNHQKPKVARMEDLFRMRLMKENMKCLVPEDLL